MKTYTTLLFDLDDTLLDFHAAERDALTGLFAALNQPIDETIREDYRLFNLGMWERYERGEIGREQLLHSRFALFFEKLGRTVDGPGADAIYREGLNRSAVLVEGADSLCAQLSGHFRFCIVTNGVADTQRKRLALSGLAGYFSHLFISQEIGHPKPERAFFDAVFRALPDTPPTQMLVVGDSLSSDIAGARNAGLDSCWFNPRGATCPPEYHPTYQIHKLSELLPLLQ